MNTEAVIIEWQESCTKNWVQSTIAGKYYRKKSDCLKNKKLTKYEILTSKPTTKKED